MDISPTTRLVVLLGDPVAHSLSPRLQNAAMRAASLDAVYMAVRCAPDRIEGLVRGIAEGGGAGNVTIPHKAAAANLLDAPARAVERTGACNTFWLEDGRLHGDNTDVEGFDAAARRLIGSPAGARVLLLGAGGAARAAALALLDARADAIHIVNRTAHRAEAVRDHLDPQRRRIVVLDPAAPLQREGYDLVVNATPAGLAPDDPPPLNLQRPARIGAVLDLAYRPGGTPWVRDARARGIPAADGTDMLLFQGAAAFRLWFGRPADLDAMRAAL